MQHRLFCYLTKQIRFSLASNLLNHQYETSSIHACATLLNLHQGGFIFLRHLLFFFLFRFSFLFFFLLRGGGLVFVTFTFTFLLVFVGVSVRTAQSLVSIGMVMVIAVNNEQNFTHVSRIHQKPHRLPGH